MRKLFQVLVLLILMIGGIGIVSGETVGTKTYYVSDTLGGLATRKLTFTNGILTAET